MFNLLKPTPGSPEKGVIPLDIERDLGNPAKKRSVQEKIERHIHQIKQQLLRPGSLDNAQIDRLKTVLMGAESALKIISRPLSKQSR